MGRASKATSFKPKKKTVKKAQQPKKKLVSKFLKPKKTVTKRPTTKRPPKVIKTVKRPRPTVTVSRPTPRPPTKRPPSVFRPTTTRPRDDFQRSLTPSLPSAFAETFPEKVGGRAQAFLGVDPSRIPPPRQPPPRSRDSVSKATSVQALFQPRPRPSRAGRGGFGGQIDIPLQPPSVFRPTTPRDVPFSLTEQQRERLAQIPRPTLEEQRKTVARQQAEGLQRFGDPAVQRQIQEEAGGIPTAFQSFVGGSRQEFENIGSIAGIGTAREEAGSLAIDLPFAVLGETFTRPSAEVEGGLFGGGGVGGLGFEFRQDADFEAGFAKSGEIQEKIGRKFEEDPARAFGSVATVAVIEAAIFVGTGGAGRIALTGVKKFAQVKGRKIAEKVAGATKEKGVPQAVENLGKGEFLITKGTEASSKRGIVLGKIDAVAIGLKKKIGGGVETILSKTPNVLGITKSGNPLKTTKLGKIPNERVLGITKDSARQADIPVIHVNTRAIVNGKRQTVVTLFTKKQIRESGFPTSATIKGLTDPKLVKRLGLEPVGTKATFAQGFLKGGSVRELRIAEEGGALRLAGKGVQFLGDDILANPKTLTQIAITGKTLGGKSARLTTTEIFEAQALGGAKFVKETGKGIGVTGVSFGSKAEARELSKLGFGDIRPIPKTVKGKPFNFAKVDELADLTAVFGDDFVGAGAKVAGVGAKGTGTGAKRGAQTVARPTQATDDIAQIFRDVAKASPEPTPRGIFSFPQTTLGLRSQIDFGVLDVSPKTKQRERIRLDQGIFPILDTGQRLREGQALGSLFTPQRTITRQVPEENILRTPEFRITEDVIPRLGTGIIPKLGEPFFPPPPPPPSPPPSGRIVPVPFGAPAPFGFDLGGRPKRRKTKKGRKSKLGGRLFDVADEPFGALTVGLGFFVETERGETSIEGALGIPDEPLTRQERQARARLGRGRRRPQGFAEGFSFDDFFS